MLSASRSSAAADGWKLVKPGSNQRVAPLMFSPRQHGRDEHDGGRVQEPLEAAVHLVVDERGRDRQRDPDGDQMSCWRK